MNKLPELTQEKLTILLKCMKGKRNKIKSGLKQIEKK
jgi:hypothetical protein